MLRDRLITGPLLIAALLGLFWLDEHLDTIALSGVWQDLFLGRTHLPRGLILFGLGLLAAPLAALEFDAIVRANGVMSRKWLMVMAAILGLVISFSVPMSTPAIRAIAVVASGMILVFVTALLTFSRHQNVKGVVAAAAVALFAMVYLGLMLGFLLALRREHSAWWIVGIVLVTKACDTGAYFTGRTIGRHKLIPWLSPGKTWEGLAGGVITAMVAGAIGAWLSGSLGPGDRVPIWLGVTCGLVFALVGQAGDLTVSLFKRGAGIKDSSQILPGLGGILDVLDSPLMVAPVAFWILDLAV